MSDSREESPDWLRSFQPPTESAINLSSGSESPLDHSQGSDGEDNIKLTNLFKKEEVQVSDVNDNDNDDGRETLSDKTVKGKSPNKVKRTPVKKRKNEDDSETGKRTNRKDTNTRKKTPEKRGKSHVENSSIWTLSSDSESSADVRPAKKGKTIKKELRASKDLDTEDEKEKDDNLLDHDGESPTRETSTVKSETKKLVKEDEKPTEKKNVNNITNGDSDDDTKDKIVKENVSGKAQVSSSRMPLLLSDKVKCTKALVECEGESIDLSGDMGSVGRIVISDDSSKNPEMFLDLKGTIFKTTIVPSRTFCVVSFGQSEAKIEALMNDYIQLKPHSNIYENETMVEGTLDGFSFDSDDEADKTTVKADQHEAAEEQPDGKTKKKPDKTSGLARKKGKPAGGKPTKKVNKKPQVSKRGKTKK